MDKSKQQKVINEILEVCISNKLNIIEMKEVFEGASGVIDFITNLTLTEGSIVTKLLRAYMDSNKDEGATSNDF